MRPQRLDSAAVGCSVKQTSATTLLSQWVLHCRQIRSLTDMPVPCSALWLSTIPDCLDRHSREILANKCAARLLHARPRQGRKGRIGGTLCRHVPGGLVGAAHVVVVW